MQKTVGGNTGGVAGIFAVLHPKSTSFSIRPCLALAVLLPFFASTYFVYFPLGSANESGFNDRFTHLAGLGQTLVRTSPTIFPWTCNTPMKEPRARTIPTNLSMGFASMVIFEHS
jgi:hypothetical protein